MTILHNEAQGATSIWEEQDLHFKHPNQYWNDNDLPAEYRINPNCPSMESTNDQVNAINAGFNTWENDGPSDMDFDYIGRTSNPEVSDDGYNNVLWAYFPDESVAGTWQYSYGNEIYGFDIAFSANVTWCWGAESGKYDVQGVATHEAGHVLELDDLYDDSNDDQTMFHSADGSYDSTAQRSLEQGDKDVLCCIIP